MVAFTKHDLQFILDGIVVSQTHASATNTISTVAGTDFLTVSDLETSRQVLLDLLPNSFEPIGMRTISGELNNLIIGQSEFGATGEFPRLTDPSFRDDGATGNPGDGSAFGPGTNTDYSDPGTVVDSDPRIISNLIVDQSVRNPAAIAAAEADNVNGIWGDADDTFGDGVSLINPDGVEGTGDEFFRIDNTAPDEGLSAPFNGWMTFFGQFFDHGLDLIKRGDENVFIPLQADDPLVLLGPDGIAGTGDEVAAGTPQIISRVAVDPGPDGILGTPDDSQPINLTSPFVDQNQTYTSHPSHQLFLREYELDGSGNPVATGNLIEGAGGGLASWGEIKAQAASELGIELTDMEGLDIPLFAVDQYGEFLAGPNGLPQFVMSDGSLVEGVLPANGGPMSVEDAELASGGLTVQRTGFSFLVDIAHAANPVDGATGIFLTRHDDGDAAGGPAVPAGSYDGDLLDAHLLSGDGRSNENFGLTTVHHVFHSEHNRVADHTKEVLVTAAGSGDVADALALLEGYLIDPAPVTFDFVDRADFADGAAGDALFESAVDTAVASLTWDGDRIFQAAKFATEMQYQHLVFEEFGRKVQPLIDLFASFEGTVDPSIVGEFAHTVYRFGHSMLTENVDHIDSAGNLTEAGLIEAFLNPLGFHQNITIGASGEIIPGAAPFDADAAAGAIVRGMTRVVGNEIDEFVTEALRTNLVGLPLDLAAINIARGRETGIPTLNDARAEFYEGTGDTKLKPYDSWFDFALNLKHEASIVNFIASYGQHDLITNAETIDQKRAAALTIVTGQDQAGVDSLGNAYSFVASTQAADRLEFLNSTGAWATDETGLNLVDFWIGGLAEKIEPFGGMLGSSFNFVFEDQMERLQDGDRFYYLGRTAGLNFISQLEQNSFANMIIRNTDIGDGPGDHLPGDIFSVPNFIFEVDESLQITNLDIDGITELVGGRSDPIDPSSILNIPVVIRDNPNTAADEDALNNYLHYTGGDHVVLGGSDLNDTIIGGIGDDTLWGEDGDDNLEGGDGGDIILGGDGDDIITDIGGPNNLQGQGGNDAIFAGGGESLILAGSGKDFVLQGPDLAETFGGQGDDFIHAGSESNIVFGNEGNDWLEAGGGANLLIGDNGDPFLNSTITGHDVFIPGLGDDDYDAESGDDIMVGGIGIQRFEGTNGFDWATYFNDETGVEVDMLLRAFDETPIPPSPATIMDRFAEVEGLSGSSSSDILRGENSDELVLRNLNNGGDHVLRNFDLIQGLREGDFGGAFDATALFAIGTAEFAGGEIILGGGGSDLIEGRGGDDMIDGDLMLGVRLLIRDPLTDAPVATALEMRGTLFQVDGDGVPVLDVDGNMIPAPINGSDTLNEAVFSRAVNPGDIHIVREIIDDGTEDFDTAVFSGNLSEYTIDLAADAQGFITVTHNAVGNNADGADKLRGIERLQFADQSMTISGTNAEPTGQPEIVDDMSGFPDATPDVGQTLRATPGTPPNEVADGDGIASQLVFTWQVELEPGTGVFTDIIALTVGGDEGPVTGETFTVLPDVAGLILRVRATFVDGHGVIETVFSDPTAQVGGGPVVFATDGDDLLNGTNDADIIEGLGGDDEINGIGGDDILIGGDDAMVPNAPETGVPDPLISNNGGNDILDGGAGTDTAVFFGDPTDPLAFEFVLDPDGNLEIVDVQAGPIDPMTGLPAGEEDLLLNVELIEFRDPATGVLVHPALDVSIIIANLVADPDGDPLAGAVPPNIIGTPGDDPVLFGTANDDVIDGLAGNDFLRGFDGNDFLIGGDGNDDLIGDAGNDTINGGNGDDRAWGFAGEDVLNGGAGNDSLQGGTENDLLNGGAGDDALVGNAGNDTINGGDGDDREWGFAGDDIISGDAGNDALLGGTGNDMLSGGDGNDSLVGNEGLDILMGDAGNDRLWGFADNDELTGGIGNDTVLGGDGDDTFFWAARSATDTDGADVIAGEGGADRLRITGSADDETFFIETVADFQARVGPVTVTGGTEIVVSRGLAGPGGASTIIGELFTIEDIDVVGGGGNDTFVVSGDFTGTNLDPSTITITGSGGNNMLDVTGLSSNHHVVFNTNGGIIEVVGDANVTVNETSPPDTGGGTGGVIGASITFTADDIAELMNLVRGLPSDNAEFDAASGIRDLEGTDNNQDNPDFGAADEPFIRLTDAHYGEFNAAEGNHDINPIFDHLDPRNISNILGDQEADLPKNSEGANVFFNAFGQYFDHGLDFLPKGGNGTIAIGGGDDDPADLTRGSVNDIIDGVPEHLNGASPFVDQNQAYGSTELVGQFLRESDGSHGIGAHLFTGQPDPSNTAFNLLPTLRELIVEHWKNDTVFTAESLDGGETSFQQYFTGLPYDVTAQDGTVTTVTDEDLVEEVVNADGTITYLVNEAMVPTLNGNFMESGYTLVGDANPFISLLDHYVAGDLRANENITLTSIHTVWARNHNDHVDNLEAAGFNGTAEELFQAAKIVNEAEYQRVVFTEFADILIGGLRGDGEHGHNDYNPDVDARISHEFAAAVYRVGHSLIGQEITVIDHETGQPTQVPLFDAFLNPTNEPESPFAPLPPGYVPQPGYEQIGVDAVIGGIVTQQAEEVDFNIVDAIRNDLVRINADLFAFNVARGWDVGLGTLNQVRHDLMASQESYISEAVSLSNADLSPYSSWSDFQNRNGLSATVIAQFMAAYPDLILAAGDIAAFQGINPNIDVTMNDDGTGTVKGIDRVDLWVGGLAEEHIRGGMVGSTFWVVLHEQFDRLQEGDRFYYLNRVDGFDFYDQVEDQSFADIVARTTGVDNLPEEIFMTAAADATADDGTAGDGAQDDGQTDEGAVDDGAGTPLMLTGDDNDNTLVGNAGADILAGLGGNDVLLAGDSDDVVVGGAGDDDLIGGGGNDLLLGGSGDDMIIAGAGNDTIKAGTDRDFVDAGDGDDTVYASLDDGDDVYNGGAGTDTYDMSAITADATIDLSMDRASSDQSGVDVLTGFENVVGGGGNDTIIADQSVNVLTGGQGGDTFEFHSVAAANGDRITDFDFAAGDRIDLSHIDANAGLAEHQGFTFMQGTEFSAAGQVIIHSDGNDGVIEGDVTGDGVADFTITFAGRSNLTEDDFTS